MTSGVWDLGFLNEEWQGQVTKGNPRPVCSVRLSLLSPLSPVGSPLSSLRIRNDAIRLGAFQASMASP